MKLYKLINKNNQSAHGGNFDWSPYLPKNNEPGIWTPIIKNITPCKNGYHVTQYPCMWDYHYLDVYEIETQSNPIPCSDLGTSNKFVCESIRLLKKIEFTFDSNFNSGHHNSGNKNSGNFNSGNFNSGNKNSGKFNSGNFNSGHYNSGNYNSGNYNSGNYNSGNYNSGNKNSGHYNSGNYNSGNYNSGDNNSGNFNSGKYNSGNFNSSSFHVGCFNTTPPKYIELFNKPIDKEQYDKIIFPSWLSHPINLSNSYKLAWKNAFDSASKQDIQLTLQIPNFDYKIFEEITGISKQMFDQKLS